MTSLPLEEVFKSLTSIHQAKYQALMELRMEQEKRFKVLLQAQAEDWRVLRSLIPQEGASAITPTAAGPHVTQVNILELFEHTARALKWPRSQWVVHLLSLLSGEAQLVAQQLQVANFLGYTNLKKAILQRVSRSPEQHCQRFPTLALSEVSHPSAFPQQLCDASRWWLLAEEEGDAADVINIVALEQFISRLQKGTAKWVKCHHPVLLEEAIQLAEDHIAVYPGDGW
ncbi:uncharacterized protein LOC127412434 [Myxocyprinus asiaticus]|uniref:uncharacterized protein LOC127412434 n=1 Tax=Myxocyprinus asiaticus TaxID=70543 RepID=UPI00222208AC|nr:uncharacterized protein LOC127412434 [Myxocyprinus asiaticus]